MKNALLVIDPQNDFCVPGASLYVPDAEKDMQRLADWIRKYSAEISHIQFTADWHSENNISLPAFWVDSQGCNPKPYTIVSLDDVLKKRWIPIDGNFSLVENYLSQLSKNGKQHTIWPKHCIANSNGAKFFEPLNAAVDRWKKLSNDHSFAVTYKGTCQNTEHFGAFMAEVVYDDAPETKFNDELATFLGGFDNIFVAGEAQSHCVANSVAQIVAFCPVLCSKLKILVDCMSPVKGFEHSADEIFVQAEKLGAKLINHDKSF